MERTSTYDTSIDRDLSAKQESSVGVHGDAHVRSESRSHLCLCDWTTMFASSNIEADGLMRGREGKSDTPNIEDNAI